MLAPWLQTQLEGLLAQRGHAWLLAGPSGLGQYALALELVRAWLCERPTGQGACGQCASCHAIEVRTHADVFVLMPETVQLERAWPLSEKAQGELDEKKRKPSREIRIDAMRDAIEFCQRSDARGRGKAVLIFPAERMNPVTANALLKTLEEPYGDVRFVLASEAGHQLLPTIRSRCMAHAMVWPAADAASAWLASQGLPGSLARDVLRAAGGRPDDALAFAQSGRDTQAWSALPRAMARGDAALVRDWTPVQLLDALHKLSHDMLAHALGAEPRYFAAVDLPEGASLAALTAWGRRLRSASRTAEHPFNTGLMLEALVSEAQNALNSGH